MFKKLQQDIENNPIIKDQMANLGCLLVCTFSNFLAPVLVAVHAVNNLDLGDELENDGYESDKVGALVLDTKELSSFCKFVHYHLRAYPGPHPARGVK